MHVIDMIPLSLFPYCVSAYLLRQRKGCDFLTLIASFMANHLRTGCAFLTNSTPWTRLQNQLTIETKTTQRWTSRCNKHAHRFIEISNHVQNRRYCLPNRLICDTVQLLFELGFRLTLDKHFPLMFQWLVEQNHLGVFVWVNSQPRKCSSNEILLRNIINVVRSFVRES